MNPGGLANLRARFSLVTRVIPALLVLGFLACQPLPRTTPEKPRERPARAETVQDPAWFGEGVQLTPHKHVDFAWAATGLNLQGQGVSFAPWEVPATPASGETPGAWWLSQRDKVTKVLQTLALEGVTLTQQLRLPPGSPPAYELRGRILSFDRQTRVGAKVGQTIGNVALVPVNLMLLLFDRGGSNPLVVPFIGGVSGFRTEVLYQVKVVDLRNQRTVLALQSWMDFRSLELPVSLREALWDLGGGPLATPGWWVAANLQEAQGDKVWFAPGLDLTGIRIRCLTWLPGPTLYQVSTESDLWHGLQAVRMPALLADPDGEQPDLKLSDQEGSLHLQGLCPWPGARTCQVKLWDPATGQVMACMEVSAGVLAFDREWTWARKVREHLANRVTRPPDATKRRKELGPTYR